MSHTPTAPRGQATNGTDAASERHLINYRWLVRLRWAAIAGQLATVAVTHSVLGVALPLPGLLAIVGFAALTNAVCTARARLGHVAQIELAGTMALDVVLFTALLYLTGGPYNPFSFLYLVYIALGAVLLDSRYTWGLVALSLIGSAFLFVDSRELELGAMHDAGTHDAGMHGAGMHGAGTRDTGMHGAQADAPGAGGDHMELHLRGMWIALVVASSFIVYFLLRVRSALATRESELHTARERASRQERLASLATLSAGAAHELATPLGTIATVAKELERQLERSNESPDTLEDLRLIRREVDRCRTILQQMSADAGDPVGEPLVPVTLAAVLADATSNVRPVPGVQTEIEGAAPAITLPRRAVAQAIRGVITNAQDASPVDATVRVAARIDGGQLRVEVRDQGSGMSPEVLARAGEPFFTTKDPGRGMGLGLFLTRAVIERLGGSFELASNPDSGTLATLAFPVAEARPAATKQRMGAPRTHG